MRIGIDATICFSKKPTGLGFYTVNIVNELAKLHEDLVVWTVNDARFDLGPEKIRKVMQPFRFAGDMLYQIRPFWLSMVLPRMIRAEKIDVLFSTVPSAVPRAPVPHVLTVLDLIPLTFPGETPWPVALNYRYRIPDILRSASSLITISDYSKRDVMRFFNISQEIIHTVYCGYDSRNFSPRPSPEILGHYGLTPQTYMLYVGNASPRKNLHTLIRAFGLIKSTVPHSLVLCGSKSARERRQLISLISSLGLQNRVMLLDYVPYRDLPYLYSGASLFIYPSLYEGFGLPVLEAMACGTPVITSRTTSLPEVAGDAALLIDPLNAVEIARSLSLVLCDPGQAERMSAAGIRRAGKFSWRKGAENVLSILKRQPAAQKTGSGAKA
jgi:glycosyltransferase involved in cell wall biosynthesis